MCLTRHLRGATSVAEGGAKDMGIVSGDIDFFEQRWFGREGGMLQIKIWEVPDYHLGNLWRFRGRNEGKKLILVVMAGVMRRGNLFCPAITHLDAEMNFYRLFRISKLVFTILGLLVMGRTHGQQGHLIIDHYTEREGLTTIQALAITQDAEGFIWIGTENGLVRYDGHRFKYFKYNVDDSTSIRSNYIKHFSLDKYNRLWLITDDRFGFFDVKELKYKSLKIKVEQPKKVFKYRYDAQEEITYLVCQNGIFTITGKKVELKKLRLKGAEKIAFTDFMAIGDRYYASCSLGLFVFDKEGNQLHRYFRPGVSEKNENENDFLNLHWDEASDQLYIGCWSYGLYILDLKSGVMKNYRYSQKPYIQNGVIAIFEYPKMGFEQSLLFATMDGIKVFDKREKKFAPFSSFLFPNKGKIEGAGLGFCLDQNERLWIGTLNGLYKLDPNKQLFNRLEVPTVEGWEIERMVVQQNTGKDSLLWFKYGYATLHQYDLIHKKFRPLPAKLAPYNQMTSNNNDFLIDSRGRLWLASQKNGVVIYDKEKDEIILPKIIGSEGKKLNFLQIYEDQNGLLYFSGIDGLYTYKEKERAIEEVKALTSFIQKNQYGLYIRDLCFDSKNKMWAIALKSNSPVQYLYHIDLSNGMFHGYGQNDHPGLKSLTSFENITCIDNDRIFINSFSGYGIGRFHNKKLEFTGYTHHGKTPLVGNRMAAMDGQQNIWICSDNGVYLLNERLDRLSLFNKNNSAIEGTMNRLIFYSKQSGKLYLDQKNYLLTAETPLFNQDRGDIIRLTDLTVSNLPGILPSGFSKLELKPDQNTIQLHFSNLNLTNSNQNYYEYRLNKDSTWTGIEGSELNFNNMGYGDYELEVRGYNSFGVMSTKNYIAVFSILPPYYRTWWFQALVFFLILLTVYSFFRSRELQYKKMARIRLNIARDLHDDLGSNLSSIKILSELSASSTDGKDKAVLKHIADKSRSMMGSISDIVWSINPGKDTLEDLVHKIQVFAIESLESIDVNLHFEIPDPLPAMPIPLEYRRHLYLIFKEGINNIAKYSGAQNVYFSIQISGKYLTMTLKDDGKGFSIDAKSNGNGLSNIRSRAEEMKARLRMHSSIAGTLVELTVNIP